MIDIAALGLINASLGSVLYQDQASGTSMKMRASRFSCRMMDCSYSHVGPSWDTIKL